MSVTILIESPFALAWTSFCNKLYGFRTEFATINVTNVSISVQKLRSKNVRISIIPAVCSRVCY